MKNKRVSRRRGFEGGREVRVGDQACGRSFHEILAIKEGVTGAKRDMLVRSGQLALALAVVNCSL